MPQEEEIPCQDTLSEAKENSVGGKRHNIPYWVATQVGGGLVKRHSSHVGRTNKVEIHCTRKAQIKHIYAKYFRLEVWTSGFLLTCGHVISLPNISAGSHASFSSSFCSSQTETTQHLDLPLSQSLLINELCLLPCNMAS